MDVYVIHKQFGEQFVFVGAYSSEAVVNAVVESIPETCIVSRLELDRTLRGGTWDALSAIRQDYTKGQEHDQFVFYPEEAYL